MPRSARPSWSGPAARAAPLGRRASSTWRSPSTSTCCTSGASASRAARRPSRPYATTGPSASSTVLAASCARGPRYSGFRRRAPGGARRPLAAPPPEG
eukprot:124420-Pyramimonas_sp.AAC.1